MSETPIRSFVSIDLDDPQVLPRILPVISSLKALGGDIKPVESENIHLTLKFLGNVTSARLAEVKTSLEQIVFRSFQVEIKGAGAFPNFNHPNVIWVGIEDGWSQVERIFEQSENVLSGIGFRREDRKFSPHVTIARVRSSRKKDEIASFLRHLSEESFGTMKVDRIRLKQSVLSSAGPKYSTLFEVPAREQ